MRIFKNKWFARYARRSGIEDTALCLTVQDASQGTVAADLGGGVLKQRVARPGAGKSGGFRVIIVFKIGELAFFVYGFAKNERSSIGTDELKAFKLLAASLLAYDDNALAKALESGALIEVNCDEEEL